MKRNQQLLEDSTAWQQQCNRLRGELASLQSQKPGVSNTGIAPEVQLTGMSLQNWQQDCIRLQSELEHLQQENQRLRTEILERDGESSGGCGCCCFQWCYYLFASKNRKNERSPGTAGITENSVTPNYYTNTGYTTIQ